MIFRKAEKNEAEAVMSLYRAVTGTPFCTWDESYPGETEITEDLSAGTLFVLEEDRELIGAISIVPENELDDFDCWTVKENAKEFARVVLRPDHQGKGLSVHLVEGIINELQKQNVSAIHIAVAKDNIPAKKLYQKIGFYFLGEADMYGHRFFLCELPRDRGEFHNNMCQRGRLHVGGAPVKIAVIQASSQANKNELLYRTVKKYAAGSEVINFGCITEETEKYSYIEISVLIGLLLASGAVDFVVTGCSSGQGMMLACNSMPDVLCGYVPTPKDAYLFAQINNGNAVSLPLGEEYTWTGLENLDQTIAVLFSEPFGQGYPRSEAARKLKDTVLLKGIRRLSQVKMADLLQKIDQDLLQKLLTKKDVVAYIIKNGEKNVIAEWPLR